MNKYAELEDVIKNEMKSAEFAKHFKHELLLNKIANTQTQAVLRSIEKGEKLERTSLKQLSEEWDK